MSNRPSAPILTEAPFFNGMKHGATSSSSLAAVLWPSGGQFKPGGCANCHTTKDDKGQPLPGMDFAGGNVFEVFGNTATANITPDATGISYYDEALFLKTLRTGHVGARPLKFPMPWWVYRNMTDDDLKSLFAFLRTVKPVRHRVDNSEPVAQCSRCNHQHAGGQTDSAN